MRKIPSKIIKGKYDNGKKCERGKNGKINHLRKDEKYIWCGIIILLAETPRFELRLLVVTCYSSYASLKYKKIIRVVFLPVFLFSPKTK
jgi:hypothetical protein